MDEEDLRIAAQLRDLIAGSELGEMETGIAKVVIAKGYDALSAKQRKVYDTYIAHLIDVDETMDEGFDRAMADPKA